MRLLGNILAAVKAFSAGDGASATPAVTNPQKLALGQAVIVVLIVLGFNLDDETQKTLLTLSAALGAALPISDAVVRHGRSSNAPAVVAAQATEAAQKEVAATPTAAAQGITREQWQALLERRIALAANRPRPPNA
jgi:hypothetical protein